MFKASPLPAFLGPRPSCSSSLRIVGEMASQYPVAEEHPAAPNKPTTAAPGDDSRQLVELDATASATEREQGPHGQQRSLSTQTATSLPIVPLELPHDPESPPKPGEKKGGDSDNLGEEAAENSDSDTSSESEVAAEDEHWVMKNTPQKTAAGILYVNDVSFLDVLRHSVDFHIIVTTSEALPSGPLATESPSCRDPNKAAEEDPDACLDGTNKIVDGAGGSENGKSKITDDADDSESRDADMESFLPIRLRINNFPLFSTLRDIGYKKGFGDFNFNHTAPFRSIIPHEKEIRSCLEEKEWYFAAFRRLQPEYAAIMDRIPVLLAPKFTIPVRGMKHKKTKLPSLCPPKYTDSDFADMRARLEGLRSLVYLLDHDLKDLVDTYRQLQEGPVASLKLPFLYLGYLYRPGMEVVRYMEETKSYQAYRVAQVTGGIRTFVGTKDNAAGEVVKSWKIRDLRLICHRYEFDGELARCIKHVLWEPPYDGRRLVAAVDDWQGHSLRTVPLSYCSAELKNRLAERGRKYTQLCGVNHRRYHGLTIRNSFGQGGPDAEEEEVDSDVIVDVKSAYRNAQDPLLPAERYSSASWVVEEGTENEFGEPFDDDGAMRVDWYSYISMPTTAKGRVLPDRDIINILPCGIWGYVLLQRKWLLLHVDLIEDVPQAKEGLKDGFERLVLPDGHKNIVRALVKTHARVAGKLEGGKDSNGKLLQPKTRQFDVVRGKGKALIMLLHGAPGVGKTSTAECVAANANRPLFPITCGDLGSSSAQEVEKNLEKFFELARRWSCVLLLDEADVFLSSRQKGDIRQNSLVSVFLRVLEYYSGILILTTNRVGSFDEAVRSRIHCALYYPPLDKKQTLKVWEMNLDLLQTRNEGEGELKVDFNREEIMKFARRHWRKGEDEHRWNGRQIRNAFQTAVALAAFDETEGEGQDLGPRIQTEHFEKVWKASDEFNKYLIGVRRSDHSRALEDEVRDDGIGGRTMSWPMDKKGKKSEKKAGSTSRRHGSSSKGKSSSSKGKDQGKGKSGASKAKSRSKKKSEECSSEEESEDSEDDSDDEDSGSGGSNGSTDDESGSGLEDGSEKESSEDDEPPPETRKKKSRKSKTKK
ncbi:hypothetical protein RB600_001340 [Gaeumannomyces tritici]